MEVMLLTAYHRAINEKDADIDVLIDVLMDVLKKRYESATIDTFSNGNAKSINYPGYSVEDRSPVDLIDYFQVNDKVSFYLHVKKVNSEYIRLPVKCAGEIVGHTLDGNLEVRCTAIGDRRKVEIPFEVGDQMEVDPRKCRLIPPASWMRPSSSGHFIEGE